MMDTKLLVVDDDPNISELLKLYFEKEGYDVRTAGDGAEAISTFKMFDPDMVLLDIMLPKKDGWQVCREIREMSSTPVIMITAKGEIFDKVLGLELGVVHALSGISSAQGVDVASLPQDLCRLFDAEGMYGNVLGTK